MTNIGILIQLIPLIIRLIEFAEKYFTSPKSGVDKKEFVIATAKTAFEGLQKVSTGGQAETVKEIEPIVGPVIDIFASQLFPKEDR